MRKAPTITNIVRAAGVSGASVSRALSNRKCVTDKLHTSVIATVQTTGCRPQRRRRRVAKAPWLAWRRAADTSPASTPMFTKSVSECCATSAPCTTMKQSLDFGINIRCALVISGEIGYNQGVHPRQHAPLQFALTH